MTYAGLVSSRIVPLTKGGTYLRTRSGAVQFGIPPETIKDSMALGLDVAGTYVVPPELFDRRRGMSVAEFEFPAYYNYFLKKRRAKLIVRDGGVEQRIRAILQEALFGPPEPPHESEFTPDIPMDARPDFAREREYFREQPGRARLVVDDLIEFQHFDADGSFDLGDGMRGRLVPAGDGQAQHYEIDEDGVSIASFPSAVSLPERRTSSSPHPAPFSPPEFGVTVLGASHGFDPAGKTTGFMLWLGGRALLVDPPTDTTEYLRDRGVPPKLIDGIILTHCHADHDAGTFQKLLEEQRLTLYTTPLIVGSFLRKYGALSGLGEDFLRRTFSFSPVRIGAPVYVRGGELWFRYRLHSIPTVGFEAYYGGKSIYISADTLFDPERIQAMHERGILHKERYDELVAFPAHHSVVLHEAGIPPLHTPVSALAALPETAKKRLRLVHIAKKDVPEGLVAADVGLDHTIALDVSPPHHAEAIRLLDAFSMVDFFRDLPLSRARALLQVVREKRAQPGEVIVKEGTLGNAFYVIRNGVVAVVRGGRTVKRYTAGDYFGEAALLLDRPRGADVVAETQVELLLIERDEFLALVRKSELHERLHRLVQGQADGTWELINQNNALSRMSSAQKTQLETFFEPRECAVGATLVQAGEVPNEVFLLDTAEGQVEGVERPFVRGAFLGDVDATLEGRATECTVRVLRAGRVFVLSKDDLKSFFAENPGALLTFLGSKFVE